DLTEQWVGWHDWNGAFYSEVAINLLRYPTSLHHGLPIVGMGSLPPASSDHAIYAQHPPGLAWLLAGEFWIAGHSEAVARTIPIIASLATLWLFINLVQRHFGRETAYVAGLFYALLPMSVYFGRMVNHEAVCLFLMMAAVSSWQSAVRSDRKTRRFA